MRQVRRPNFQPAPEPPSEPIEEDSGEAPPTFADEAAISIPAYGAGGPVETRPHWISRDQRVQGRRMAQLRRSSGEDRGVARTTTSTGMMPTFAMGSISGEIRQILITTGAMLVLIVVLTVLLR